MSSLQQRPCPPVSTAPMCLYGSVEFGGRFYVHCWVCQPFHGVLDSRTSRLLPFTTRKGAEKVCRVLNGKS
jgi:hypothetical protein